MRKLILSALLVSSSCLMAQGPTISASMESSPLVAPITSTKKITLKGDYKELWNGPDGGKTFWCDVSESHCCTIYVGLNRTPQRPTTIVANDKGRDIAFDCASFDTKVERRGTQVLMKDAVIAPAP